MKKLSVCIVILIFCGLQLSAQESALPGNTNIVKGYYNITEMGFLAGPISNNHPAPFSIMNINGYQFTPHIAAGVGVGIEFIQETYLPVTLDLRYYFRDHKFSPFIFVQGGYNIPLTNTSREEIYYDIMPLWSSYYPYYPSYNVNPKGGILINPGFGIKNMFNENLGFLFTVAYRYQRLNYNADEMHNKLDVDYNRLVIKFAFIFN